MEQKHKTICPSCHSSNTKKNGKRNGIQRYYCKNCEKTFIDERISLRHKKLLSMLWNFIKSDGSKNLTIKEAIKNIDTDIIDIDNFILKQRVSADPKTIFCYNPKLLICEDADEIVIYRIEKRDINEKSRSFSIIDEDKYRRNPIIQKLPPGNAFSQDEDI